jgi:CelD/BcsL family acetyltransferase involved in cellulose biosynthesis
MTAVRSVSRLTQDSGKPDKPSARPEKSRDRANTSHGTSFQARLLDGPDDPFFLAAEANGRNVFLSRVFLAAVEKHLLGGSENLALVGVTDDAGDPVALFPFVKRKKFGVLYLEGVDFGLTDYFAPACLRDLALSPAETTAVWRTVVKAVPGVHAIIFKKLPRQMHGQFHALSAADFLKPMGADATTLFIQAEGAPTVVPKKMLKKLEQIGPLAFHEAQTNAEVDAAMEKLVAFRTARFSELGRRDALLDPHVVDFYRDLADRERDKPAGRLFTLHAGGHIVAVIYSFAYRDVFTMIAPAMTTSKEMQAGSPGLVAFFKALQWCRSHDFKVFDLSVGSLSYKSRFDAQTFDLFEHQQALTPLGLPIVAEAALRRMLRHLALKHPEVRTRLETIASKWNARKEGANA